MRTPDLTNPYSIARLILNSRRLNLSYAEYSCLISEARRRRQRLSPKARSVLTDIEVMLQGRFQPLPRKRLGVLASAMLELGSDNRRKRSHDGR